MQGVPTDTTSRINNTTFLSQNKSRQSSYQSHELISTPDLGIFCYAMTDKRLCFCQWSDCKKFRQIILDKTSNDHPWSSGIVRLTFPQKKNTNPSKKSISWQVSICRHLLINNLDNDIPGRIDRYPHHFPLALLKWR